MVNESLNAARVLMGDSLGFHIIFVMFGLTLPILVSWFEFMGIRRKDKQLINLAKFWSKIMSLLVIAGVISGTIIALQMSLVWPGILKFGGEVIGYPFLFETYAFLIEAVFLALYMLTWNAKWVSKWLHWVFGLFVIIGSTMSAYAITMVNGWMNLPVGFEYVDGKMVNVDLAAVMFSRTGLIEFAHSMPGYYLASALFITSIYLFKILFSKARERLSDKHQLDWFIVQKLMVFALIMFVFSAITADITGKYLAKYEPTKLAAIELNYQTRSNAPLLVGGVAGEGDTIKGPHFEIPGALSLLAGNSTDTKVVGLREFDQSELPPLYVHTLFDIKMTLITALVLVFIGYFAIRRWRPKLQSKSWFILPIAVVGLTGIVIVELGWMLTEIGRQPWAVREYVTTAEALTKTHDITSFGYLFPIAYLGLFVVTLLALIKLIKVNSSKNKGKTK